MKKQIIQLLIGVLLAFLGLFFFFKNVRIAPLWENIKSVPLWAVAGVTFLSILSHWLRAIRWNMILPQTCGATRKGLFGLVMIAFMINNFVPARLGEAVRMLFLWKRNKFTLAESVGSVIIERVLDTIIFLSFFFIPAFFIPALRSALPIALPLASGVAVVVAGLFMYAFFPRTVKVTAKWGLTFFPKKIQERASIFSKELVSNLEWLYLPRKSFIIIVLSLAIVVCHPVMLLLLAQKEAFSFLSAMFGSGCAALGAAIPLSPGYVGTLHAALLQGLTMTGLDADSAGATTILYHAVNYIAVSIVGLYFFFSMKISFSEVRKAKEVIEIDKDTSSIKLD